MADEEQKAPAAAGDAEHINLRVVSQVSALTVLMLVDPVPMTILMIAEFLMVHSCQDGGEVYFKIKKSTNLKKLMDAYIDRQGLNPNSIRFLYDGERVRPEQTPKELEMEDNDIIDAVLQQTGGY